jgi:hypothetical protein
MKREIKIFRSFEEQEEYKLEQMRNTTVTERFQMLYAMQQMTKKLHPSAGKKRRIIISKNEHIK